VSIYAASSNAAKTFTIYGTNRFGATITEAITGPGAGATVNGTKNFVTVTRVAIDAASVGNVEVGSSDELESQPVPVGEKIDWEVVPSSGASLNWGLQYTHDSMFGSTTAEDSATWFSVGDGNQISSALGDPIPSGVVSAVRLAVYSYASGTVTLTITPHRRGQ
jgi:hypothetical protein